MSAVRIGDEVESSRSTSTSSPVREPTAGRRDRRHGEVMPRRTPFERNELVNEVKDQQGNAFIRRCRVPSFNNDSRQAMQWVGGEWIYERLNIKKPAIRSSKRARQVAHSSSARFRSAQKLVPGGMSRGMVARRSARRRQNCRRG